MVALSAKRLVCLAIASIEPETLATWLSAAPTAASRASIRPTAATSSAMWLTAVWTTRRDSAIWPAAADAVDCTACDALAMS
jgi:hypothetical protein